MKQILHEDFLVQFQQHIPVTVLQMDMLLDHISDT